MNENGISVNNLFGLENVYNISGKSMGKFIEAVVVVNQNKRIVHLANARAILDDDKIMTPAEMKEAVENMEFYAIPLDFIMKDLMEFTFQVFLDLLFMIEEHPEFTVEEAVKFYVET